MTYSPVPVESFGGLRLLDDPGTVPWSAAIDLLNVDLDREGRVRSRDGYTKFTSATAATGYTFTYGWRGQGFILAQRTANIDAIDTVGAVAVSAATVGQPGCACSFGTPAATTVYVGYGNGGTVRSFNGAAWTNTALGGAFVAPTNDQRLAYAAGSLGNNKVKFSDAGAPTTIGANNFVDLDPGDGEAISGMVAWREQLFVFKQTKFFVFYGTSTDSSGNPIFNYRPVRTGIGAALCGANSTTYGPMMVCAGTDGVYFVNEQGVWITTGGEPTRISRAIDPLFTGEGLSSFYAGGSVDVAANPGLSIAIHRERLYLSMGGSGNTLVYDPATKNWLYWSTAVGMNGITSWSTSTSLSALPSLYFSNGTTGDLYKYGSAYTSDNGTAITSRYRSGFSDLGTPNMKTIRQWRLEGSGSPTFKASHDFGSLETGAAVTLGTAPAVAEKPYRFARRGRQFSFQIGATSAWSVNSVVADVREKRAPGAHSSS